MPRKSPAEDIDNAWGALFKGLLRLGFCAHLRPEAELAWNQRVKDVQKINPAQASDAAWTLVREYDEKTAPLYLASARDTLAITQQLRGEERVLIRQLKYLIAGAEALFANKEYKSCIGLCDLAYEFTK